MLMLSYNHYFLACKNKHNFRILQIFGNKLQGALTALSTLNEVPSELFQQKPC